MDDYTVIATARDPSSMPEVKTGKGSKLIVVKMDQSQTDGPTIVGTFDISVKLCL